MKFLSMFILLISWTLHGQSFDSGPRDQIDIYLHTVNTGSQVYDNFGHTAIRVHNKTTGHDLVFNWGIFDFSNPVEFSLKFYKGILNYRLGVYTYQTALSRYQYEKRTVWEDKLDFTENEKNILLKRLAWNTLKENVEYPYHYFFNNCSTKVRDYIDEALSGALKAKYEKQMTGREFRDTVQKGYSTNPEIQLPLDIIMNSNIDNEMSVWQQMFLPLYLRQDLIPIEISGRKIITDSKAIYEFPGSVPFTLSSFQMLAIFLLILFAGIYYGQNKKEGFMLERWLFIPCFLILLVLGIFGFAMPLNWVLSDHIDLHHNANMLLLWPTDFVLLWPLFLIITKGRKLSLESKRKLLWDKYIFAHIAMNILFFLMWLVGIFSQDVSNPALYLVPCLTILLILVRRSYNNSTPVIQSGGSSIID